MSSIRDEEVAALEIGDVIYECEMGMNIEVRVMSKPIDNTPDELEGRRQWRWTAENTQNGKRIDYLLTEGLSQYGPRLYRQPQYMMIDKEGNWSFPLLGAPEAA